MKKYFTIVSLVATCLIATRLSAQSNKQSSETAVKPGQHLYLDVHHIGPGKVTYEDVMKAHAKDLAVEKKYGVDMKKFWFDEEHGDVYCLASSADSMAIRKTHAKAHGLMPDHILEVTTGVNAPIKPGQEFFLDIHELGAGKVTDKDVAAAHQKDLTAEQNHGVNFVSYWVNAKKGTVVCLSQAPDSTAVIETHKEAHGLLPQQIMKVKQGN